MRQSPAKPVKSTSIGSLGDRKPPSSSVERTGRRHGPKVIRHAPLVRAEGPGPEGTGTLGCVRAVDRCRPRGAPGPPGRPEPMTATARHDRDRPGRADRPRRFTRTGRLALLGPLTRERILVLDGAMGTMVQSYGLSEADFRGERFADHPRDLRGDNDLLALTRPDIVPAIHDAYLEAGADIVETNTFTATSSPRPTTASSASSREINRDRGPARPRGRRRRSRRASPAGRASSAGRSARPTGPPRSRRDVNDPGARNVRSTSS